MTTLTARAARDGQRARVYRAEDAWAARLDAARSGARLAIVAGSAVLLPAERRFGTLEGAASYLARVVALPATVACWGVLPTPVLRLRAGAAKAHWEPPGVIAVPVPVHGEPWALRETVLLHELAHHVVHHAVLADPLAGRQIGGGRQIGHGPGFPAALLALVVIVLGEEAALALRVAYGDERVEVGAL